LFSRIIGSSTSLPLQLGESLSELADLGARAAKGAAEEGEARDEEKIHHGMAPDGTSRCGHCEDTHGKADSCWHPGRD